MSRSTELAIIGAGPAGANAALAAAAHGRSVTLLDEQPKPGGQVWRAKSDAILDAPPTPESIKGNVLRQRVQNSTVLFLGNTRVWHIEHENDVWVLHLLRNGQAMRLHAKALVLATGAREFVQPVPGWTLPGVLGLAGATALFKQELALPGQRTIVSGTGPLVLLVASEIRRLGGQVAAVVTPNSRTDWLQALPTLCSRPDLLWRGGLWVADLTLSRVPIYWRHAVTRIEGSLGVEGVQLQKIDSDWAPIASVNEIEIEIESDSICMGTGLIPAIEAPLLAGLAIEHKSELGGWVPVVGEDCVTRVPGLFLCGDGAGIRGVAAAEIHGTLAGLSAATFLGIDTAVERKALRRKYEKATRFGTAMTTLSAPRAGLNKLTTPNTIVCRCESLSRADIDADIQSGANSVIAVKSDSRAGMGACGGKFCQTMVARLIANYQNRPESDVYPSTARPPLHPVPVSTLAGDLDYEELSIPKPAPL